MSEVERRFTTTDEAGLELRQSGSSGPVLEGYAARFGSLSKVMEGKGGRFRERIEPGAFGPALQGSDVRALFNHDSNHLLGRELSGTLEVEEDGEGLRYEVSLDEEDPDARRVLRKVERGDLAGSSFSFVVASDGERMERPTDSKYPVRVITEFSLVKDLGPVTFPAYEATSTKVSDRALRRAAQMRPNRGVGRTSGKTLRPETVRSSLSKLRSESRTDYDATYALAHHEAGHAVAQIVLGAGCRSVELRWERAPLRGHYRGKAGVARWRDSERLSARQAAIVYAAGEAAERLSGHEENPPSWTESDREHLSCSLRSCVDCTEEAVREEAREIVEENWHAVRWTVRQLLKEGRCTVPGEELEEYMEEAEERAPADGKSRTERRSNAAKRQNWKSRTRRAAGFW